MATKIYTKTGDLGETSLFGGKRLPKDHIRIESYGTIDELNSYLGLLTLSVQNAAQVQLLKAIQDRLFTIGSHLACDPATPMMLPDLEADDLMALEHAIDTMQQALPPLKHFILSGGHTAVAHTHVARCICRRAERVVVALAHVEPVTPMIVQYLNRLSDYLFVLARWVAQEQGVEEVKWLPRQKNKTDLV